MDAIAAYSEVNIEAFFIMLKKTGEHEIGIRGVRIIHRGRIVKVTVGRILVVRLEDQFQIIEDGEIFTTCAPQGPPSSGDAAIDDILIGLVIPESRILTVSKYLANGIGVTRPLHAVGRVHACNIMGRGAARCKDSLGHRLIPFFRGAVGVLKDGGTMDPRVGSFGTNLAKENVVVRLLLIGKEAEFGFDPVDAVGRFRVTEGGVIPGRPPFHVIGLVPHPIAGALAAFRLDGAAPIFHDRKPIEGGTLPGLIPLEIFLPGFVGRVHLQRDPL